MLDFQRERFCCGCGACANVCPTGAVVMEADEHGFLFPAIDNGKCVGCGKCDAVCPYLNADATRKDAPPEDSCWLYACPDADVKTRSSSGGAFYTIARAMTEQGAYVAGCAWADDWKAVHTLGRAEQDLQSMQGSKYVQSDTRNIYRSVLEKLENGETVVFSGTPCQAVAMDRFLRSKNKERYRERLVNIAIICHGVSSPMAWETYKRWLESREKSELTGVNFRDKSLDGYKTSWCSYSFANGASTYLPTYLPSFITALRAVKKGIFHAPPRITRRPRWSTILPCAKVAGTAPQKAPTRSLTSCSATGTRLIRGKEAWGLPA